MPEISTQHLTKGVLTRGSALHFRVLDRGSTVRPFRCPQTRRNGPTRRRSLLPLLWERVEGGTKQRAFSAGRHRPQFGTTQKERQVDPDIANTAGPA